MTRPFEPVDAHGKAIQTGDPVVLRDVPDQLLDGLPEEEQKAIRAQKNRTLKVVAFDESGYAELEFTDAGGMLHTIWVEPRCLEKAP
jgi:hypothetical protein